MALELLHFRRGLSEAQLKVNFPLIIRKYTVHLPFYLSQLSLLLRALNKLCLQLSVKDSVETNKMVGELYISLCLEQNSPLTKPKLRGGGAHRWLAEHFLDDCLCIENIKAYKEVKSNSFESCQRTIFFEKMCFFSRFV